MNEQKLKKAIDTLEFLRQDAAAKMAHIEHVYGDHSLWSWSLLLNF
ncbi:hypothetical protein LJK88_04265 [Paenibacillus sp. P26]|nr:hypothetical protein LJK88_04265 [Paenibacillus sp. P26]